MAVLNLILLVLMWLAVIILIFATWKLIKRRIYSEKRAIRFYRNRLPPLPEDRFRIKRTFADDSE